MQPPQRPTPELSDDGCEQRWTPVDFSGLPGQLSILLAQLVADWWLLRDEEVTVARVGIGSRRSRSQARYVECLVA